MKTIFILLAVYLAYIVIKGLFFRSGMRMRPPAPRRGEEVHTRAQDPGQGNSEATVEDPVCGSYVPVSAAVSEVGEEGTVYFCSTECRDRYLASRDG